MARNMAIKAQNLMMSEKCREYRLSLGIKQNQVAKELDLPIRTVASFEHGNSANMAILNWYIRKGILESEYNWNLA